MWINQFKVLLPAFISHWVLLVGLAVAAWYLFTRIYTNFHFDWRAPAVVGSTLALFFTVNTTMNLYQNTLITTWNQKMQAEAQAQQNQPGQQPQGQQAQAVPPEMQAKADFLKVLEAFLNQPSEITAQNKTKLFTTFGALFPKGKPDKDFFFQQISQVYSCQKHFWEDAIASYKAKRVVKSKARAACEGMDGSFFNREKIVTLDMAKNNDNMIGKFASGERVPASDGKEVDEAKMKGFLNTQVQYLESLKKIFE